MDRDGAYARVYAAPSTAPVPVVGFVNPLAVLAAGDETRLAGDFAASHLGHGKRAAIGCRLKRGRGLGRVSSVVGGRFDGIAAAHHQDKHEAWKRVSHWSTPFVRRLWDDLRPGVAFKRETRGARCESTSGG